MLLRNFEAEDVLEAAVESELRRALAFGGLAPHAVMLTGGKTPLGVYRRLECGPAAVIAGMHVIMSDERCVDQDSPQNNLRHLRGMLQANRIAAERVIAVDGGLLPQAALNEFRAGLESFIAAGGVIPLALLGLGADGHLAGLFTREDVESQDAAVMVQRADGLTGISAGASVLRLAKRVIFMVKGADKQNAVDRLLEDPQQIPAGMVYAGHSDVEIWYWQGVRD